MNLARFVAPFLLVAVLAGCSSAAAVAPVKPSASTATAPAPTSTATTPASAAASVTDAQYLQLVRDQGWVGAGVTDAQLLKHGQSACDALLSSPPDAAMTSWNAGVRVLVGAGLSAADAVEFLVFASSRFCPEVQGVYFPGNPG